MISDILYIKMPLAHVTETGNISIPKKWRDELGIAAGTSVILEKKNGKLFIEPMSSKPLKDAWKAIDQEIKRKKIQFTMEEAIRDDLYD